MRACDAAVIGAGPAGSTAALRLAQSGWSVAIVEKTRFPRPKVCGEYISATSWPLLRALGVAEELLAEAGPEVRRVGLYAGAAMTSAEMPAPAAGQAWGHAIGRDRLDATLLERAVRCGVQLWQPWSAERCERDALGHVLTLVTRGGATRSLRARVLVAAHGSWEHGALPTQERRRAARPGDLFGFKVRLRDARLPPGLMPLVLFPGGYGGMVRTDHDLTTFSCCIRRDALRACRARRPQRGAGDAVLAHVIESCRGVREALGQARADSPWLSAGPIRPGMRPRRRAGLFAVGNAAGEAHPLVAEGISMAIQSAWLLCERLAALDSLGQAALEAAGRDYAASWRARFATRLHASAFFAAIARPHAIAEAGAAALARAPGLLTWGAHWSGKAKALAAAAEPPA